MSIRHLFIVFFLLQLPLLHAGEEVDADPLPDDPCENGEALFLQQSLGYADADGNPADLHFLACKSLPYDVGTAIVAVLYPSRTEGKYEADGELDLHLLHIDAGGEILRQETFRGAAFTGGFALSSIGVDTGLYRLAEDQRAFGLRLFHRSHCSACEVDVEEESLNLFMPQNGGFRWVLRNMVAETQSLQREANEQGCLFAGQKKTAVLNLSPKKTKGLADIFVTTTISEVPGGRESDSQACARSSVDTKKRTVWRFDGEQYRLAVAPKSP